jgi:prepilin-type N-terminal cleavage/methylation domain-containing protein
MIMGDERRVMSELNRAEWRVTRCGIREGCGVSGDAMCGVTPRALARSHHTSPVTGRSFRHAFTLVELLVVISIMAILAALIFPVTQSINRNRARARTKAEMKKIEAAIEIYKDKRNSYPPDNPGNPFLHQLFYELSGTVLTNATQIYGTLDGNASIAVSLLPNAFLTTNVGGFANASQSPAGEESSKVDKCLISPKSETVADYNNVKILVGSLGWPATQPGAPLTGSTLNPWRYVSTNPTNNPNSYDLWIDVFIGGKTNRICNWSDKPVEL